MVAHLAVAEGFYYVKSNMGTKAIEAAKTEWSIIGAAVGGWDPANDVVMSYDKTTNCWSVTTQSFGRRIQIPCKQRLGHQYGRYGREVDI